MEAIDLMSRISRLRLGVPGRKVCGPVEPAEVRDVGIEKLVCFGELGLYLGRHGILGESLGYQIHQRRGLFAGMARDLEDCREARIGDNLVDGHGLRSIGVSSERFGWF